MAGIFFSRTDLEFIGELEGDLQRKVAQLLQQFLLLMADTHHQRVLALLYPHRVLGKGNQDVSMPSLLYPDKVLGGGIRMSVYSPFSTRTEYWERQKPGHQCTRPSLPAQSTGKVRIRTSVGR